jgi:Tol biopolymer transport system component/tRNA A-37 threonylcarbamoyl transferase component Bud32
LTLAAGTKLGPYEIVAPVGAGGMGEVYRARDTRLDRTVAVKVLPPHLSEDAEHRRRFEREAKMISALSHPHICALHDVGHQDGTDYLVMEYVEGETLSERLVKGPLPTEQVLRYGVEIADALDKAHRQGIVHRDLKPGNVMLTRSGVKLLDFGLAKMRELEEAPAGVSVSLLATRTSADRSPLTEKGTILGTFQYMAPEQLEGKEADARSDLFAFGAVLYEMATGQKAFTGKTQASLIGAILHTEPPPISSVQPLAPQPLDRVVKTCLAKDPEDRWQTAHDVKLQLRAIAEAGSQAGVTPAAVPIRPRARVQILWLTNAATFAAAILLGLALFRAGRNGPPRVVVSSIDVPEKTSIAFDSGAPLISPDGRKLALVLSVGGGRTAVWLRSLDGSAARLLAGTEGAVYPFWSPDSRHLAFFADGKLRKVNVESGGPADTIADAPLGRGGTWNREGDIVFAPDTGGTLFRVSSSGGATAPVTTQDEKTGEISHRYPSFLPDGRHFVYEVQVGGGGSQYKHFVGSLDSKPASRLPFASESNVVYSPPGYLLFVQQGNLRAQPFDVRSLRPIGESFAVADVVQVSSIVGFGSFSVSEDGLLAYVGGAAARFSRLVWTDRAGKELETVGTPAVHWDPRLSHDGKRLAFAIEDSRGNSDIWIYDVARRISTRFTFDPDADLAPVWSPDDGRIVFTAYRRGPGDLFQKISTGSGAEDLLLASPHRKIATDFSPDGRLLAYHTNMPKTSWNTFLLALSDRKPSAYLDGPFPELAAGFSPDGRWIAYVSAESGVGEVYVQSFPKGSGKWQISSGGGAMPIWRQDGRELFFLASDGKLMAVGVKSGATFEAERPESLFSGSVRNFVGLSRRQYDVTADGQRFILNAAVEEQSAAPITLVQNWTAKAPK